LNPETSNDRVRITAAYELAHILYGDAAVDGTSQFEQTAYAFASSLLLPESQLRAAFDGNSFLKLIQYKERFGISLSAMIYMAEKSRIVPTTTSRWLWKEMGRRGWRQKEPGFVWRDRAITFEMMLECAVQGRTMTWADAERVTGICESELRDRLFRVTANGPETKMIGVEPEVLRFEPKTNGA
jgi:Zn-dependent peptidase ImmA (M78 family)